MIHIPRIPPGFDFPQRKDETFLQGQLARGHLVDVPKPHLKNGHLENLAHGSWSGEAKSSLDIEHWNWVDLAGAVVAAQSIEFPCRSFKPLWHVGRDGSPSGIRNGAPDW